jgi:Protein of unknown function (DUF732)
MNALAFLRHQPLPIRVLTATAALLTAAAAFATPAEANQVDDDFVAALNKAGVHYNGDPANAVALGQSVCPMLAKPGAKFAEAVAKVEGGGISSGMAGMFAQIAIQMYCPQMMAQVAHGQIPSMPGIPGVPGI